MATAHARQRRLVILSFRSSAPPHPSRDDHFKPIIDCSRRTGHPYLKCVAVVIHQDDLQFILWFSNVRRHQQQQQFSDSFLR